MIKRQLRKKLILISNVNKYIKIINTNYLGHTGVSVWILSPYVDKHSMIISHSYVLLPFMRKLRAGEQLNS